MKVLMVSKACVVGAYRTKLEAIAAHDVELKVVVPPVWKEPGGDLMLEPGHTEGYDLLVESMQLNGKYHMHFYPGLAKIVRDFRPNILHMDEEPYSFVTWRGMRLAQSIGAKLLFFSWQNISREYPPPFKWMEKQVLNSADFGIMGNRAAEDVWRGKGYTGESAILPQFGASLDLFLPKEHPPKRIKPFTIGSASRRLNHAKGVDLMLNAAARLTGDWCMKIAGDGGEREQLEQMARDLRVADRVDFIGKIGSEEVPAFLRELDVLVLPSRTTPTWKEQFGRVLVESMATEVPVIGSDSGEIPHVIGEAGFVFQEGDVDELFVHLQRLLNDEELGVEIGRKGRQRALNNFTQAQIAARTVEIYRSLQ